jgi:hypothetical protein
VADPTIRFCAGSPERQYSAVWRIWAHRNDVYLGARSALGLFKLSLHESGKWITAFTSGSGAQFNDTGNRRHHTWTRPGEFAPGWTQGPTILLPWVRWADDPRHRETLPRGVEWIRGPRRRGKLMINVLFAGTSVEADGINTVSRPGDALIGSFQLGNGETVWLQARWRPMHADEIASIESHAKEYDGFRTATPFEQMSAWAIWVATGEEAPLLIQIPLGRRHFK